MIECGCQLVAKILVMVRDHKLLTIKS
jgi:hypothetical protein